MTTPEYEGFGDGWIVDSADPRLSVLWPASEDLPEDGGAFVFYVSRVQCEEHAPRIIPGDLIPENYIAAQILQARGLVRAGITDTGDRSGFTGEGVVVFPMDWTVKNLLRPKKGRPYFGGKRP